ncbi:glycosyltransferase [Rhabdobacter roseus]|uniref:Glycosyltransferase involved in cell wall biosynthesis n=1 Tax=Rhabdobacter roseus TaxID=1655419 RepID=A0A840TRX3_9BACT|nr:glycosyltransferase [Rhabdobacter roseus]MBB5286681.1 glycosyltransferase involved in cell wall biosynthesis [Rhabdobacter roseus]
MRIGLFLQDLKSGGAEKIMVGFANYLVENSNDEVYLILVREEGPYIKLVSQKVNIIYLNKSKTLYSFLSLYQAIKKLKIDYLYSTLVNANILALIVGKTSGTKVIIREANNFKELIKNEKRFLIKIAYLLTNYLYKFAYKGIAISESVKKDLLTYTNINKLSIHVIYNPIITIDTLKVNLDNSIFHIGLVSRLTTQKNIETICKILNQILVKNYKICFHFFGEGDTSSIDNIRRKYNASDKIVMHGFNLSYYSYIKKMDLFIHIPLWEGLGNSVLEVYNSGLPMILSDVNSGFSELIKKDSPNIHYVQPLDDSEILNIIELYYKGENRKVENRKKINLSEKNTYARYRSLAY